MANICANRVAVYGPEEAVLAFVAAAKGPVRGPDYGLLPTEMRIIDEVRAGKPVAEAFRDANLRIDRLIDSLPSTPMNRVLSASVAIPPVDESEFEQWAADVQSTVERMSAEFGDANGETYLSLQAFVPMPDEVARETYGHVGYHWQLIMHGCKWHVSVAAPSIEAVPDPFGGVTGQSVAVYPLFDSPNSPPFPALLAASARHPEVTVVAAFADPEMDSFLHLAARGGSVLAEGEMDSGNLPRSCFGRYSEDDGFMAGEEYVDEASALVYLCELAYMEAQESLPSVGLR